jgi:hypothetical protein
MCIVSFFKEAGKHNQATRLCHPIRSIHSGTYIPSRIHSTFSRFLPKIHLRYQLYNRIGKKYFKIILASKKTIKNARIASTAQKTSF